MRTFVTYWVVVRAMLRHYGVGQTVEEALHAVAYLLPALLWPSMRTTPGERARRRSACRECDIYNHALGTCGTPGDQIGGTQKGCWCPIATSSIPRSKACWKEVMGQDRWAGTYGYQEKDTLQDKGPAGE